MTAQAVSGPVRLQLPVHASTADHAVGDWVLVEPETRLLVRRLDRRTLLQRRTEGGQTPQLIAANVNTLFIVTSCNDDLNVARLERFLALANEAGITPVIVLTKADQVPDAGPYREQVAQLQRGLDVVTLNAKSPDAARALAPWCGTGQTVALVGSSGVGKSSLLNTLAAKAPGEAQLTGSVREADSRGRHTTTSRSLHAIVGGGWVIDPSGIRTLQVSDISAGLDLLFAEISELAPHCRFGNCTTPMNRDARFRRRSRQEGWTGCGSIAGASCWTRAGTTPPPRPGRAGTGPRDPRANGPDGGFPWTSAATRG